MSFKKEIQKRGIKVTYDTLRKNTNILKGINTIIFLTDIESDKTKGYTPEATLFIVGKNYNHLKCLFYDAMEFLREKKIPFNAHLADNKIMLQSKEELGAKSKAYEKPIAPDNLSVLSTLSESIGNGLITIEQLSDYDKNLIQIVHNLSVDFKNYV